MKHLVLALGLTCATTAAAADWQPVSDEGTFLSLLDGRQLTIRLYNLALNVTPNGQIAGGALGWDITGTWSWEDGYFCREMEWGGDPIPYNCQLVEVDGDLLRFTTDQGAGDSASLRLR
ncbi:MAG: dihydrodipicolinate reductase [Loktanella sp.]|nr:dihydrodipicolinate reductase [Loktanella sp.]